MKILHRYILTTFLRNFAITLAVLLFLFLMIDFTDRIDVILGENPSVGLIAGYFILKIPYTLSMMIPIATLVATLFTFGILSRNSEITAMRGSGVRVLWLALPVLIAGIGISIGELILNETLVPVSQRRVREIYDFDIMKKDKKGGLSQDNIWWRDGERFYSASRFDSRSNVLHDLSRLGITHDFMVFERLVAERTSWINEELGWNMSSVSRYSFKEDGPPEVTKFPRLPLPILQQPSDFFDIQMQPDTMSYRQLRKFLRKLSSNGLPIMSYLSDLYQKLSFPLINFVVILVALPFALKPARTGSMATSFIAGLIIAFCYYAIHSFSVAMGRAEIYPPLLAAWMANLVMLSIGLILNFGAESPR